MSRCCIVFGAGRSGTSVVAHLIAQAGFHTGDNYIAPRASNPGGFFEDSEVNDINEELLATSAGGRGDLGSMPRGTRWLAAPPIGVQFRVTNELRRRMEVVMRVPRFCYKDPRFSFTLPAWRPYIPPGTRGVLAFRAPWDVIGSTMREAQEVSYLAEVRLTEVTAAASWIANYRHALRNRHLLDDCVALDYEHVVDASSLPLVESLLGIEVDRGLIQRSFSRSRASRISGASLRCLPVYSRLVALERSRRVTERLRSRWLSRRGSKS